nr:MAG TPA: tumor necrosis factor receptor superfamily member 19 [Caudoviricetes sp.]
MPLFIAIESVFAFLGLFIPNIKTFLLRKKGYRTTIHGVK